MSDAKQQALAQVESIVQMVAALEVDYDYLDTLQHQLDEFIEDPGSNQGAVKGALAWAAQNPDAAAELTALKEAAGDNFNRDQAYQAIQEDPLSIEVRSGWQNIGEAFTPEEFRIVLCTGGPHVEILGELDQHGEPSRVRIIYKDWSEAGELFDFDREAVLKYARQFVYSV